MEILFKSLLIVAYVVVGCILATPYFFLSGGGTMNNFLLTELLAPIGAFLLFVFFRFRSQDFHHRISRRHWTVVIAYVAIWLSSPIIANFASLIFKAAGMNEVGIWTFRLRYAGLLAIPLLTFLVLLICSSVAALVHKLKLKFGGKPPTHTPMDPGNVADSQSTPKQRDINEQDMMQFVSV